MDSHPPFPDPPSGSTDVIADRSRSKDDPKARVGRVDWSQWPAYDEAAAGLDDYWYPAIWSTQVKSSPVGVKICGQDIVVQRDTDGSAYALHDRCVHRGVKLSLGKQEFAGTITCPYHAWTYRLNDGELVAVITDGPDSPMCGKASIRTYPCEEYLGLVWVYVGGAVPHPLRLQLPEELADPPDFGIGGRIEDRAGNWRLYSENGFDEGHAKYLHRTSLWDRISLRPKL